MKTPVEKNGKIIEIKKNSNYVRIPVIGKAKQKAKHYWQIQACSTQLSPIIWNYDKFSAGINGSRNKIVISIG